MGAVGGVVAVVIGLAMAWALVGAGAGGEVGARLQLPWPLLATVVLIGTGVAALAGIYPARVAARLPIVRSIAQFE
jgi:ABC-type antimicrobial peptide transport system permease subunit